jgi:hypothetical protein
MPTNTYVELARTVASAAASVTFDLTSISGYKDLVIIAQAKSSTSGSSVNSYRLRFNGLSTTLYSNTYLSNTTSTRDTNGAEMYVGALNQTSLNPELTTIHIMNYANTTTFKNVLARGNSATSVVNCTAGLWRSTAAITSINLFMSDATLTGTFSLYGIKAIGGDTAVKATGGIVTEDATYFYHTFKGSSSFTPLQSLTADILVVAGGGGGGNGGGGGGGAGGLLGFATQSLTAQVYPVVVGGGAGATVVGSNSQFGSLTTAVGGGGGGQDGAFAGRNGGSGGGGGSSSNATYRPAGSASPAGQGNNGGTAMSGSPYASGGGGGAGAVGQNGSGSNGGNGGAGVNTYSTWASATTTGVSGFYAGGGGGATYYGDVANGTGGSGGGGNAGTAFGGGVSGVTNTGSGGGGGSGGRGGSGIVIVRYTKA